MYLINKQHISLFKACKQSGQITGLVKNRAGCNLHIDPQLIGYYMSKRGLTQSRRTMKKNMIKGFSAQEGCLDENLKILYNLLLT